VNSPKGVDVHATRIRDQHAIHTHARSRAFALRDIAREEFYKRRAAVAAWMALV